jgi:hypothetical protein
MVNLSSPLQLFLNPSQIQIRTQFFCGSHFLPLLDPPNSFLPFSLSLLHCFSAFLSLLSAITGTASSPDYLSSFNLGQTPHWSSLAFTMKRSIEDGAAVNVTNSKKPVFLTKAEREALALKRRQQEADQLNQRRQDLLSSISVSTSTSNKPSDSDRHRDSDRDRDRDRDRERDWDRRDRDRDRRDRERGEREEASVPASIVVREGFRR